MFITFGDVIIYVTVFFGIFTSLFFLMTLLENSSSMKPTAKVKYEKVCIIVPCYNEEKTVGKTVESLLALDYPEKLLEIVVVDDGSTDNTYEIARKYESFGVKVLRKPNGGKFTALNYVIKRTDAVYVGALDADSFVDPKALRRMLPYFANPKVMAVTPSMKVHNPKHWLQKVQWTEYLFGIFLRKIFAQLGSIHVTPGPFSIYKREFFLRHGLYRHAYNTEDIELALRIQTKDYEIENAHDAFVYTVGPDSFKSLWNQRLRWYYGFLRNTEDYSHLFSPKHGILGVFILPTAFISIALVLASLFYIVYQFLSGAFDKFIFYRATGFDFLNFQWNFDAFFLNLNSVAILGILAFLIGLVVIFSAKAVAGERSILKPYLWFMATYWMLYGLWWVGAIYLRVVGKKMGWRHKSET